MIPKFARLVVILGAVTPPNASHAQSDPFHVTNAEKAACTADATRLCESAYPNEGKLLACMLANKTSLSPGCLVVFNAGLKRRHLVVK